MTWVVEEQRATDEREDRTDGRLPLSPAQLGRWHAQRTGDDGVHEADGLHHRVLGARIEGDLDISALRQALDGMVARHEALRVRFGTADEVGDNEPWQAIQPPHGLPFGTSDLSGLDPARRTETLRTLVVEQIRRRFDLTKDPALRAHLIKVTEQEHVFLLIAHQLVADERSWSIITDEITRLYRAIRIGDPARFPPVRGSFGAAVLERHKRLDETAGRLAGHWRTWLDGAPPVLDLPADRARPATPSFRTGRAAFDLPPGVAAALTELGERGRVGTHPTLLAAFGVLLARHSGQEDIVIGVQGTGDEPAGVVGCLSPVLPVRIDCSGDPSFADLLRRVDDAITAATAHQDLPAGRIMEELGLDPAAHPSPLFQVMFTSVAGSGDGGPRLALDGLRVDPLPVEHLPEPYDLSLTTSARGGELRLSTDLFDQETVERMTKRLETLLTDIATHPDRPISRLALLDPSELELAVTGWNRTRSSYPDHACVADLFESRVAADPDAVAVVAGEERLTYGELNARANQLGRFLRARGVGPESLVAVFLDRTPLAIVAFFGVLKAGGACLPLDIGSPSDRLGYILADADAAVVLTRDGLADRLPGSAAETIRLDSHWSGVETQPDHDTDRLTVPDSLAYVIYTSGSTGHPKGVGVTHRGVANLSSALGRTFRLRPTDRVAQFASLSFDASVWEIVMALLSGPSLAIVETSGRTPAEIAVELDGQEVTVGTFPPAYLNTLRGDELPAIHTMISAGEACSPTLVRTWGVGRTFVNAYGPTEATVCATLERCDTSVAYAPPIGRPLQNTQVYILDRQMHPVPVGVPGELYIGGVGLARGYHNRPRLTAQAFVPNPFGQPGSRLYRTGDLAQRLPDGRVQYIGRVDHQVKIRGFRVELGEIEAAIARYPAVREAVVVVNELDVSDHRLIAYIVLEEAARRIASRGIGAPGDERSLRGELHGFLQDSLPEYMLPSRYVTLDALPLTTSGKVDRAALPEPDLAEAGPSDDGFARPETSAEQKIAAIWAEVLGLERVARDDDFLEIGGHSLVAAQVIARVRQAFVIEIPIRVLFENSALIDFAAAVEAVYAQSPAAE